MRASEEETSAKRTRLDETDTLDLATIHTIYCEGHGNVIRIEDGQIEDVYQCAKFFVYDGVLSIICGEGFKGIGVPSPDDITASFFGQPVSNCYDESRCLRGDGPIHPITALLRQLSAPEHRIYTTGKLKHWNIVCKKGQLDIITDVIAPESNLSVFVFGGGVKFAGRVDVSSATWFAEDCGKLEFGIVNMSSLKAYALEYATIQFDECNDDCKVAARAIGQSGIGWFIPAISSEDYKRDSKLYAGVSLTNLSHREYALHRTYAKN